VRKGILITAGAGKKRKDGRNNTKRHRSRFRNARLSRARSKRKRGKRRREKGFWKTFKSFEQKYTFTDCASPSFLKM